MEGKAIITIILLYTLKNIWKNKETNINAYFFYLNIR